NAVAAPENRILLPTGDGMCIALIATYLPYDIHLTLAVEILSALERRNTEITDPMRRFEVRIGLGENVDNLVTDANGHPNVAGYGINTSQRVMSLADGNQILVSRTVFETLRGRERYMNS